MVYTPYITAREEGMYHDNERHELTKDEVKAIRMADEAVVFRLLVKEPAEDTHRFTATSVIVLHRRENKVGGYTVTFEPQEIPADWSITDYKSPFGVTGETDLRSGVAMVHTPTYNEHWRSIVNLVRPGDSLKLFWSANNQSQSMIEAGFFVDSCDLAIFRKKGDIWTQFVTIEVAQDITQYPDNRMLRPARAAEYTLR